MATPILAAFLRRSLRSRSQWILCFSGVRASAFVVVNNNKAELRPITIGHDLGSKVEVVAGLSGDESVVINPPDSIEDGETVRMVQPSARGDAQ